MIFKIKAVKNFQSVEFEIDDEEYEVEGIEGYVQFAARLVSKLASDIGPSEEPKKETQSKPATEKQLQFIKTLGGNPNKVKTYDEANKLIRELKED